MWLVISYDIPSPESSVYRQVRRKLLQAGFAFPQKSLAWKWVQSAEKAASIQKKIGSAASAGHLLFWRIPDQVFAGGTCLENGMEKTMPHIPTPWIIV